MAHWKDIAEAPGYQVSDVGEIRRVGTMDKYHPPKSFMKKFEKNGYWAVGLSVKGKKLKFYVHRLVAKSFIGSPPTPNHQVAHGDGNKKNNALSNLRWATRKENQADRLIHGTDARGEKCATSKLTWDQVRMIRESRLPQKVLSKDFGVDQSHISRIRTGARNMWKECAPSL